MQWLHCCACVLPGLQASPGRTRTQRDKPRPQSSAAWCGPLVHGLRTWASISQASPSLGPADALAGLPAKPGWLDGPMLLTSHMLLTKPHATYPVHLVHTRMNTLGASALRGLACQLLCARHSMRAWTCQNASVSATPCMRPALQPPRTGLCNIPRWRVASSAGARPCQSFATSSPRETRTPHTEPPAGHPAGAHLA